jgi:hypothetical protein
VDNNIEDPRWRRVIRSDYIFPKKYPNQPDKLIGVNKNGVQGKDGARNLLNVSVIIRMKQARRPHQ